MAIRLLDHASAVKWNNLNCIKFEQSNQGPRKCDIKKSNIVYLYH